MPSRIDKKIAPGIYRLENGKFRVKVSVGDRMRGGRQREKTFLSDTGLREMKAWQVAERAKLWRTDIRPAQGTLAADIERYLGLKRPHLTSPKERQRELGAWLPRFGHRNRHTIEPHEIQAQLNEWRTGRDASGRSVMTGVNRDGKPASKALAARTCNLRRTALSNLFTVLDGKRARNPVADVPRFNPPTASPQQFDYRAIRATFEQMADSQTKARLLLTAYAGFRPSEVMRAQAEDAFLDDSEPYCYKRVGKRGRPVMVPLPARGVEAWRMALRTNAIGRQFSLSSANRSWKRAMTRAGEKARIEAVERNATEDELRALDIAFTPRHMYALRHSYATKLYHDGGGDLSIVQLALGHTDIRTTRIYTTVTKDPRLVAAVQRAFRDDTDEAKGNKAAS
jgi:integrase